MEYIIWGLLALVVILGVVVVSTYNALVNRREAVRNDYRQIDIQLDRRFKVFNRLSIQ